MVRKSDGPRMEVDGDTVRIWIAGELPSLRKPSGMNFRQSDSNVGAKIRAAEKADLQQTWHLKLLALGAHHEIKRVQRVCAKRGRLVDIQAIVTRRQELDYKNLVTAVDEILIDPLQRGDEPILYTDSPKNVALHVGGVPLQAETFAGGSYVHLQFSVSQWSCGAAIVKRYQREVKGGKSHGRQTTARA